MPPHPPPPSRDTNVGWLVSFFYRAPDPPLSSGTGQNRAFVNVGVFAVPRSHPLTEFAGSELDECGTPLAMVQHLEIDDITLTPNAACYK